MKLIECVPNFSEGRDLDVVNAIRDRIAAVPGATVLHVTADASHNRSVITFVAPSDVMPDAAFAAIRAARDRIDISAHSGVHPRIGAADVVPFIPLDGATMDDCVTIARTVGKRVGDELDIPVYLYERAATRDSLRNLADVRRGGLEAISAAIAGADRAPDFGPRHVHPTFGAVAIGARPFLVAFNCYIGDASRMQIAREIARSIRESSGGLPAVKALALEVDGQAQVSMNLVDIDTTSLATAFAAVEREAESRGAAVTWSEIIGLVPERVIYEAASGALRLRDSIADHSLERLLLASRASGETVHTYLDSLGAGDPFPGGGSAAAVAGALAAALTAMVARLTLDRPRYASVAGEMRDTASSAASLAAQLESLASRDSEAYAAVTDARRLPSRTPAELEQRASAITAALRRATEIPLEVARLAAQAAELAAALAERGNVNAISDAGVAAALALAACKGAAYNVMVNVRSLAQHGVRDSRFDGARAMLAAAEQAEQRVASHVLATLGDTDETRR